MCHRRRNNCARHCNTPPHYGGPMLAGGLIGLSKMILGSSQQPPYTGQRAQPQAMNYQTIAHPSAGYAAPRGPPPSYEYDHEYITPSNEKKQVSGVIMPDEKGEIETLDAKFNSNMHLHNDDEWEDEEYHSASLGMNRTGNSSGMRGGPPMMPRAPMMSMMPRLPMLPVAQANHPRCGYPVTSWGEERYRRKEQRAFNKLERKAERIARKEQRGMGLCGRVY